MYVSICYLQFKFIRPEISISRKWVAVFYFQKFIVMKRNIIVVWIQLEKYGSTVTLKTYLRIKKHIKNVEKLISKKISFEKLRYKNFFVMKKSERIFLS